MSHRPDIESNELIAEVKSGLAAMRGMRSALVELVGSLADAPGKHAVLLLVEPKVTAARIDEEWRRFRAVLRPEIARNLSIAVFRDGRFDTRPADLTDTEWRSLEQWAHSEILGPGAFSLPRPDRPSEVARALLLQWFLGRGPVTVRWLQETVGCTYRTVATSLERLGRAVKRHKNRSVELKYFPKNEWAKLVATSERARATRSYAYRSGEMRSTESLVRRLRTLERSDLALGGVLGARHHQPDLDLLGLPRVDVSVHSPSSEVDLAFLRQLDPALNHTTDPDSSPRLVLHFLRRKESFFEPAPEGSWWADPVECLLDLHEGHLEPQALEFVDHLIAVRTAADV